MLEKGEILTFTTSFMEAVYVQNTKTQRVGIVEYSYTVEMTAGETADATTGKVTLGSVTITAFAKDTAKDMQKKFTEKVRPALAQFEKDKVTFNKSQWKKQ